MEPSLSGCRAKVWRAAEHLKCLGDEIHTFFGPEDDKPHRIHDKFDPQTLTYEAWIEPIREPTEHVWGVLLGDYIHNLRSTLDHLIWQLVILNTGKEPTGRQNQFPIASRGTQYWCARKNGQPSMRDSALANVADEHRAIIDQLQPYRRGNGAQDDPLDIIGSLSNIDKPRLVHPALFAIQPADPSAWITETVGGTVGYRSFEFNAAPLPPKACTKVVSARLQPVVPGTEVDMKGKITVDVAFGERRIRDLVFPDLLDHVNAIIGTFERFFPQATH